MKTQVIRQYGRNKLYNSYQGSCGQKRKEKGSPKIHLKTNTSYNEENKYANKDKHESNSSSLNKLNEVQQKGK